MAEKYYVYYSLTTGTTATRHVTQVYREDDTFFLPDSVYGDMGWTKNTSHLHEIFDDVPSEPGADQSYSEWTVNTTVTPKIINPGTVGASTITQRQQMVQGRIDALIDADTWTQRTDSTLTVDSRNAFKTYFGTLVNIPTAQSATWASNPESVTFPTRPTPVTTSDDIAARASDFMNDITIPSRKLIAPGRQNMLPFLSMDEADDRYFLFTGCTLLGFFTSTTGTGGYYMRVRKDTAAGSGATIKLHPDFYIPGPGTWEAHPFNNGYAVSDGYSLKVNHRVPGRVGTTQNLLLATLQTFQLDKTTQYSSHNAAGNFSSRASWLSEGVTFGNVGAGAVWLHPYFSLGTGMALNETIEIDFAVFMPLIQGFYDIANRSIGRTHIQSVDASALFGLIDPTTQIEAIPTSHLTGTILSSQIDSLAASKIAGSIQGSQIADVPLAKLTSANQDNGDVLTWDSSVQQFASRAVVWEWLDFYLANPAQNIGTAMQTLFLTGTTTLLTESLAYQMPRAGRVIGARLRSSAVLTSGAITLRPIVSGSDQAFNAGSVNLTLSAANRQSQDLIKYPDAAGALAFAAGTSVGCQLLTSGTYAPATNDYMAKLLVMYDPW